VRDGSDVHVLAISSVSYIESADDYVAIQTESATHIKLDGLNKLQEKLDPRQF
jgi:DNA-binding LytR/AlgR family response regulator